MAAIVTSEPLADETTARLVDAAAEVFAEKGYDKAGVAEIARRAGLTTGAIYSRFSGKAELLAEAIRACTEDEFDQLFAEHGFDGDAAAILGTVGNHLVTREPDPHRAILLEAFVAARRDPEVGDELRRQFTERRSRLAELLRIGQGAGIVDPDLDVQAVVHFAHAVGLGFLLYEALGVPHPDPDAWDEVVRRVVAAMDPPTARPNRPASQPTTAANPATTESTAPEE